MLVEIQSLVAPQSGTAPRRAVVGWDTNRLNMILAVLEARCGVSLANKDIYLNVAGGLKITEPACDMAVAASIISALVQKPVPADMVVFGEIGLSGETRAVAQPDLRLKEASKLGFERAMIPPRRQTKKNTPSSIKVLEVGHLKTLVDLFAGEK